MKLRIAVIIVNYGIAGSAADAVDSVISQTRTRDVEIHVVDNASPGEDAKLLTRMHAERNWGDRVTLWPEDQNHGFGEGNNIVLRTIAARAEPPELVFLLNPDACLQNDAIEELAAVLEANPTAGAVGAGLLDTDGKPASAAFRFPGMISEVNQTISFGPVARLFKSFHVALPPDHTPGPVDWVSGAAVMFRLQAISEVNFFDPEFFLYFEEVDLMRRLKSGGWDVLYAPAAQVLHMEGVSTGVRSGDVSRKRNPPYLYHSWRHYFSKSLGRGRTLVLALLLYPAAFANIIVSRLRGRQPSLPLKFFADHWQYVVAPLMKRRSVS